MSRTLEALRIQVERTHRRRAAGLASVLFLCALVLCFYLTAYSISIPPPGEQYVAVGLADFGNTQEASGDVESEVPSEVVQEAVQEESASAEAVETSSVEEVVTQAQSEVAVPTNTEPVETETDPEPDDPNKSVSTALSSRFSSLQSGGGGSQGSEAEGAGNEGNEEGDMFENGTTVGNLTFGISDGGKMLGRPQQEKDPTASGVVRVNLTVGPDGKVLTTKYDPTHSTLGDSYHVRIAEEAAKTAIFAPNSTVPRRTAYIEFRYILE
jgi:hypothetical protein